ncbi:MAG: alpha/beta hydrolase [Syntrophales bacterium]|jgi:pimeloyl-ACP methyl ester carboxylesterase|nr:alpha/beta hydrolase [Syntrophales bacterium]MDY0045029.1 alpha/beta hydrolase [Syntrophales bacterium]
MGIGVLFFMILGFIVAVCIIYLLIVAVIPWMKVPSLSISDEDRQPVKDRRAESERETVLIPVKGVHLEAWLYVPSDISGTVPCIVMGHGFGGTKRMGLGRYASRFREEGFAVLVFDYRYFGGSEGTPRQLIWIPSQLEDWSAAIEYARSLERIDSSRIALWGTSLSGGHVIVKAASDHGIACAIAQCPGVDGRASAELTFRKLGIGGAFRMIVHGQRDLVRSWMRLSPHKMPIVGKPGDLALLTSEGAYEAFRMQAPVDFINEACARIIVRADKYRPIKEAPGVRCPVLLQICNFDNITPGEAAEKTAASLGHFAEVKHYPIGHFDIYEGENFEESLHDQLIFFKKHLSTPSEKASR